MRFGDEKEEQQSTLVEQMLAKLGEYQKKSASPYNFKGSCLSSELPASGNTINDTYYCTDLKYRKTWNGSAWEQSSLNEADYEDELTKTNGEVSSLKEDINEITDILYSKNNIIPNHLFFDTSDWESIGTGTFTTYVVDKYYKALRMATNGSANPITYTDIENVSNIRYFKMTTVGSNLVVNGNIDIIGYPTNVSSGGTSLYSSGNIEFTSSNGTDKDIFVDMGNIDCSSYHHIRLIITFLSKTKTLLAYKMYLGNVDDEYSFLITELQDITAKINPLKGKRLFVDGDSICYGAGYTGGYAKIIGDKYGMTVVNLAVSGGTIASNTYFSDGSRRHWIANNLNGLGNDFDYYIIEGGFNDAGNNVNPNESAFTDEISTIAPTDLTTTVGAMEKICYELTVNHAGKKIGFIFPHKIDNDEWKEKNNYGYNWGDYKALQKKILKKWGVPFIDIAECGGLNTTFTSLANAYTNNGDKVHPNYKGYTEFYVDKIVSWLKSL